MVRSEKHMGMGQRRLVMVFYVKYFCIVFICFLYRVALNLKWNKRLVCIENRNIQDEIEITYENKITIRNLNNKPKLKALTASYRLEYLPCHVFCG